MYNAVATRLSGMNLTFLDLPQVGLRLPQQLLNSRHSVLVHLYSSLVCVVLAVLLYGFHTVTSVR